jgi:fructose-bisphosphate aldolase class II
MKRIVAERMKQFGQAGHADDYEPLTLAAMRLRYETEAAGAAAATGAAA